MHTRLFLAVVASLMALALSAEAQPQVATRPKLSAAADTNNWEAYYNHGVAQLTRDRRLAENAFTWASRLDPSRAEPLYALWVTFWARDPEKFGKWVMDDDQVYRDPAVGMADSLRLRAFRRNPFVHQGLILHLFDNPRWRFGDDVASRGWLAFGRGQLPQALSLFGMAIDRDPRRNGHLRFIRASAFVNLARYDSALAVIDTVLTQLRREDDERLVRRYESKEMLEYARGLLHTQQRNTAAAREAFGQALVENAGFTPAKAMLGQLALSARDTATALFEYSTAVEIDPEDVMLRLGYARALLAARRPGEAVPQLLKATELAPYYAEPFYQLGVALEQTGQPYPARNAFAQYLALAPQSDSKRAVAREKLSSLATTR